MPNKNEHIKAGAIWGAIIGGLSNLIKQNKNISTGKQSEFDLIDFVGKTLLSAGLGGIGAILPDILEPATNPNHRAFFHSLAVAMGMTVVQLEKQRQKLTKDEFWNFVIEKVGLGYLIHLIQDSETPKGLPLI